MFEKIYRPNPVSRNTIPNELRPSKKGGVAEARTGRQEFLFVKTQFTETARSKAPIDETIKKLANAFGDEMKKRYDLLFASQLVAKMKGSGFLKEEVIALLIENKPS